MSLGICKIAKKPKQNENKTIAYKIITLNSSQKMQILPFLIQEKTQKRCI